MSYFDDWIDPPPICRGRIQHRSTLQRFREEILRDTGHTRADTRYYARLLEALVGDERMEQILEEIHEDPEILKKARKFAKK